MALVWTGHDEAYLADLAASCQALAQRFKATYHRARQLQSKIKIPSIVLSSLAGAASFSQGIYPQSATVWVAVSVGLINVAIAIASSLDAFLETTSTVERSRKVAAEFQGLADRIGLELALPFTERELAGDAAVRHFFQEYESIVQASPPTMRKAHFVKPESGRFARGLRDVSVVIERSSEASTEKSCL